MLKLIVAFLSVSIVSVGVSKLAQKKTDDDGRGFGIDLVEGQARFAAACSGCHSIVPGAAKRSGPDLSEIGRIAATRKPGMSATDYIAESIVSPSAFKVPGSTGSMPENLYASMTPRQFGSLIAYLASQGAKPDFLAITKVKFPKPTNLASATEPLPSREQLERGESLFRGKAGCNNCHRLEVGPEYRIVAPTLFSAGHRDPQLVRNSVLQPSQQLVAGYEQSAIALNDGTSVIGRILFRTPTDLTVLSVDPKGQPLFVGVPVEKIEREGDALLIQKSESSPMPAGYGELLSSDEIDDLVRFVTRLN